MLKCFKNGILTTGGNMKLLILMLSVLVVSGCKPTAKDIEKVLSENPDLVFKVIEDNPEKFIKSAQTAARKARPGNQGPSPEVAMEEEFKNPKTPQVEDSRVLGSSSAPITIVEYTDLECPFCSRGKNTILEVMKMYEGKVKVVLKHLPLPMHNNAKSAAQYYEAIAKTHSLEKAHKWSEEIFKTQGEFRKGDAASFYDTTAKKLKLDVKKVKATLKDEKALAEIDARIQSDMEEARRFGFQGTPGYLINGVSLKGAYPLPNFKQVIDRHLSAQK